MIAILEGKTWVNSRDVLYDFNCPELASLAKPGQFVQIKVSSSSEPYFRRPISIYSADQTSFKILVRLQGKGTKLMTEWRIGEEVDILGPLGCGFSWPKEGTDFILVAGGIGMAPLNFLAERLVQEGKNICFLMGAPRQEELLIDTLSVTDKVRISTDDGSFGYHGLVTELLEDVLKESNAVNLVFTCGPKGMVAGVAKIGAKYNVSTQVSLEEKMACGIGACLGCVVAIKTDSGFEYKKVCHDGPVFKGEEVLFGE